MYDGLNPVATYLCNSNPVQGLINYLLGVGLDELYLTSNAGVNDSYLRDALNSTLAVTSASGTILDQVTYDPYGNSSDSNGSYAPGFKFTGREYEGAGFAYTTLYNLRGRYYNAALGRFISRDPAGLAGGVNLYAYAGDDPVDFSDPTGTDWESILEGPGDVCAACIGGFVGAYQPHGSAQGNQGGLDRDVTAFYNGSQNGGGLHVVGEPFEKPGGPVKFEMEPLGGGGGAPDWFEPAQPEQPALPSDLDATLQRIARGERFPHVRDGTVFQNKEGRLPLKPPGYYKEYVVPTPGVSGPGARRVVIGAGGEVYYTPNHYDSFIQVK